MTRWGNYKQCLLPPTQADTESADELETVEPRTPYSAFARPPEGGLANCLRAIVGWSLALVLLVLLFGVVLVMLPLLFVQRVLRAVLWARVSYHRDPKSLRIAIVGGGWGGVQTLVRLHELGVTNVKCFERSADLGGTFGTDLRYHGLQIHAAMYVTSFKDFPYSQVQDEMDGKVRGDTMLSYMCKYCDKKDAWASYTLNSNVTAIHYDSKQHEATLVVQDTKSGELRTEGPFDLVIYSAMASCGAMPEISGVNDFAGAMLHCSDLKEANFKQILRDRQNVVVVGAGKSACDMVINFVRKHHSCVKWICRRPYYFLKYEAFFHDRSALGMLRGMLMLVNFLFFAIPGMTWIAGFVLRSVGMVVMFGAQHNDWFRFHFGTLCARQRRDLLVAQERMVIGNPVKLSQRALHLSDGRMVECDMVIWATGYRTGIDQLTLVKDGQPYLLEEKLYNHFIAPHFPVLASAGTLFTTFGPMRATNSAELAVYHLCCRRPPTEDAMERDAQRNLAFNSPRTAFLFATSHATTPRKWVYLHLDLLLRGLTTTEDFLLHLIRLLVLGRQEPLRFNILPALPRTT